MDLYEIYAMDMDRLTEPLQGDDWLTEPLEEGEAKFKEIWRNHKR